MQYIYYSILSGYHTQYLITIYYLVLLSLQYCLMQPLAKQCCGVYS